MIAMLNTDLKQKIVSAVQSHLSLPHYKIFLFGSRARGRTVPQSDIDIGIEAPQEIPAGDLLNIQEAMSDLPIMQKVDVVDFSRVDHSFRSIAQKNIEVLHEQ